MKKFIYLLIVGFAIIGVSSCELTITSDMLETIESSLKEYKIKEYKIGNDEPHQYIFVGYGMTHYTECKYCTKKMEE